MSRPCLLWRQTSRSVQTIPSQVDREVCRPIHRRNCHTSAGMRPPGRRGQLDLADDVALAIDLDDALAPETAHQRVARGQPARITGAGDAAAPLLVSFAIDF